jgi:zinc protease
MMDEIDNAAQLASVASGHRIECTGAYRYNADLRAVRYSLENGLTIVLAPDTRAPAFAYQSWFRVGSKHEHPELTGLAHLFEHLMFKGTRHHPPGELDREMERRGAQTNAATWVDWTYYLETLAAQGDNFETVVAFEADRMHNLVLDEETFASELGVVKNERRMTVDDSVVGELSERLYATAYTHHPYRWPTIGTMEHLERATLEDLERFYRTYYAPNNATVVVVGSLPPEHTLSVLARAYGGLAPQSIPEQSFSPEPPQHGDRLQVIERPVVAPQILIGFRAPAQLDPDFAAVEMLGELLVVGDNARLYRRLVTEEQIAADVSGYLAPFAEPGLYEILVTARPGVQPQRIIELTQDELDRLVHDVGAAQVEKARSGLELSLFDSLKDAEGVAEALGHYQTNYGDYRLAFTGIERWARVSVADLRRTAAEVFRSSNRTTIAAVSGSTA